MQLSWFLPPHSWLEEFLTLGFHLQWLQKTTELMGPSCKFLLLNQPNFCHLKKKKKKKILRAICIISEQHHLSSKIFSQVFKKTCNRQKGKIKRYCYKLKTDISAKAGEKCKLSIYEARDGPCRCFSELPGVYPIAINHPQVCGALEFTQTHVY